MKNLVLLSVFTFLLLSQLHAQNNVVVTESDSLIVESQDTVLLKSYASRYNPRKALLYAAILPGLGQIYNKKYWKLPLVYGGFFGTTYAMLFYNDLYRDYKRELFTNLELGLTGDSDIRSGDVYTTKNYRVAVDRAKRSRDFWLIMMGAMYLLQIVDAHVDAHLKEFDLNPQLRVSIEPMMEQNYMLGKQTGFSLVVKF
ncbi:DUF5683 domain-containing protein [Ohtaekwangia koreensis]|uniref:DUF5683 domain-containing protein n=1 Tax=Ohtaekwangia koreensis TaxID=688867 RepID=A0A1T5JWJ8_9BACT|nr:DUF5683 domain-containing protein [Ohtaekwangia koreensis]SKC55714.1 hypothetical protein SAMN05660236_1555 [Ohtaekwangia koreensis]